MKPTITAFTACFCFGLFHVSQSQFYFDQSSPQLSLSVLPQILSKMQLLQTEVGILKKDNDELVEIFETTEKSNERLEGKFESLQISNEMLQDQLLQQKLAMDDTDRYVEEHSKQIQTVASSVEQVVDKLDVHIVEADRVNEETEREIREGTVRKHGDGNRQSSSAHLKTANSEPSSPLQKSTDSLIDLEGLGVGICLCKTLQTRMTAIETKNTEQDTAIAALTAGGGSNKVYFDYTMNGGSYTTTSTSIPFPNMQAEAGINGAFDASTGTFTAAKAGTYVALLQLDCHTGECEVDILKDATVVSTSRSYRTRSLEGLSWNAHEEEFSAMAVLDLAVGNAVNCQLRKGTVSESSAKKRSHFIMFLLYPDA